MPYTERYVRADAAGGGDGTTDSASGANGAWTLAEAATNAASGQRVNIKSGTYTLGANLTFKAGSTENPIIWQGFSATVGDLESVGRSSATGALTTTNFPLIDGGASFTTTCGNYTRLVNLNITSAANAPTVNSGVSNFWRCRFANTNANGAAARAFSNGANYIAIVDCDNVLATINESSPVTAEVGRGSIIGCRVWHSGTPHASACGILLTSTQACAYGNIVYNMGIAIELRGLSGSAIHNSWHGVTTGIFVNDDHEAAIVNNVGWSHAGYAIRGTTSSGIPLMLNNAFGSHTSGRIDTSTLGSVNDEINAILLTSDPFTNSGSQDFTLNSTSGGGALCRAASKLFGGFGDLGAVQVQPSGGGVPLIGRGGLVY